MSTRKRLCKWIGFVMLALEKDGFIDRIYKQ